MKGDRLGEFEFLVLAAVLRAGEGAYGVPIREVIEQSVDRTVSMGAVYSTLDRLERKGLVRSHFGAPRPERGGKARRFFEAEAAGVEALRTSVRDRDAILDGLELGMAT